MAFIWGQFHKIYLSHHSIKLAWKWPDLKLNRNLPGANELTHLNNQWKWNTLSEFVCPNRLHVIIPQLGTWTKWSIFWRLSNERSWIRTSYYDKYLFLVDVITNKAPFTERKCCHFDEIFIIACTGSCQFDNFRCNRSWKVRQNDISVSVIASCDNPSPKPNMILITDLYMRSI